MKYFVQLHYVLQILAKQFKLFNLKQLKDKYFLASEVTTLLNKITPSG